MKKGFTLAEVLITLGIIGVVSAITIPTLVTKIQKKQLESQIKVAYAEIQQAMKGAEADGMILDGVLATDESTEVTKQWFNTYLAPNLKTETLCINQAGCWHKKGTIKDLQGKASPWDNNAGLGTHIITFKTAKGTYYNIDGMSKNRLNTLFGINADSIGLIIYFDANGDKRPNKIGIDIHTLVMTDKGLKPAGSDRSSLEVTKNCEQGDGYWCLQKFITESWTIPDKVWKR